MNGQVPWDARSFVRCGVGRQLKGEHEQPLDQDASVSSAESGAGGKMGRDGELKRRCTHPVATDQRLADEPLMLGLGLLTLGGDLT